jgi:chitosanase
MKFTSYCTLPGLLSTFAYTALAIPISPSSTAPPPTVARISATSFAADPSINVAGIYAAAHASNTKSLANFPTNSDRKVLSSIYGDWQNLPGVSAFHFIADMDTDCDGTKVGRYFCPACPRLITISSSRTARWISSSFASDRRLIFIGSQGNRDGQTETSFGALDATKVPYFVLPEKFTQQNKAILKDNALGAIICDGKMFYGIYGDQEYA